MTPEDLEQIRAIAREETAAAESRIVDRLTETMRDMQTEIIRGLERFSRGNFARMARQDASITRLDAADSATNDRLTALEERVLALETRQPRPVDSVLRLRAAPSSGPILH